MIEEYNNLVNVYYKDLRRMPRYSVSNVFGGDGEERSRNNEENNTIGKNDSFSVFEGDDWQTKWKSEINNRGSQNTGIILTAKKDVDAASYQEFIDILTQYIEARKKDGIYYYVIDVGEQSIYPEARNMQNYSVLGMLKKVYAVGSAKYLMIVNGAPEFVLDNRTAGESDRDIPSDLPYLTLDNSSPWQYSWKDYSFENSIRVGRVLAGENFEGAKAYFKNALTHKDEHHDMDASFSLSAYVWKETSERIKSYFSQNNDGVLTSPDVTVGDFNNRTFIDRVYHYNEGKNVFLMHFNLHGNSMTSYWYGQNGNYYPEAYSKDSLPQKSGYVIATEACYGARKKDLNKDILPYSLKNGCLNFVGSSRIAYGNAGGWMSCADVVTAHFLKSIKEGYSAGDSFACALNAILDHSCLSDVEIKTIAEFALYGDPSLSYAEGKSGSSKKQSSFRYRPNERTISDKNVHGYDLVDPNEFLIRATREYVKKMSMGFDAVKPRFYQNKDVNGGYQAVYSKKVDDFEMICRMYFDNKGKVTNCLISK